ncbi:MBL fold metallo-hydrolase [Nocardioides sp. BP30]|uniref:MBL fold metallo-hydrolase n=1 Tax=Nocardioides sp. BP30 TaxID=3036374 RepID=UPI0024694DB6|nr:MBL fold metallo-hydrolase [Nocardioides sp. BP30]WGL50355.1 MBL fold metallo-hydrolase [Nocardioides sp. BP30]
MKLTKYTHASVSFESDGARLLLDPGTFGPESAEQLDLADAVLITHEHFDHLDVEKVGAALQRRPELEVYGPSSIVPSLTAAGGRKGQLHVLTPGQELVVSGVHVQVFGGAHAPIHPDIPVPQNLGYLLDEAVFHPGDSYVVPGVPVHTLLVPTSGPWTKVGEAIDFVRAVAPRQTVPIHDVMLSEIGQASVAMFLGEGGPTGVALHRLEPSQGLDL